MVEIVLTGHETGLLFQRKEKRRERAVVVAPTVVVGAFLRLQRYLLLRGKEKSKEKESSDMLFVGVIVGGCDVAVYGFGVAVGGWWWLVEKPWFYGSSGPKGKRRKP
ncbi:hypothetical protein DEO72_LG9g1824 [Vigna unguiculata]|uniref:Transmembrane protein n=1 Tax=Vigna unguiculata TaxID=3917 RepID=A0A4D6MZ29_VIGUN|nr:hypothetical protein DEO72_LG9g1824 [Vigna unguiculata]